MADTQPHEEIERDGITRESRIKFRRNPEYQNWYAE